jgi:hypothetical protein
MRCNNKRKAIYNNINNAIFASPAEALVHSGGRYISPAEALVHSGGRYISQEADSFLEQYMYLKRIFFYNAIVVSL